MVDETFTFLRHQPMFRNIKLEKRIPPDLPNFNADANQLSQILMNLLLNAAQATAGRRHASRFRATRSSSPRTTWRSESAIPAADSGRHSASCLRAVLHDQARQRHRPGTQHQPVLRAQPRRRHFDSTASQAKALPFASLFRSQQESVIRARRRRRSSRVRTMAYSILVIDDESLTLRTISRALRDEGFDVFRRHERRRGAATSSRKKSPTLRCWTWFCRALMASKSCARSRNRSPDHHRGDDERLPRRRSRRGVDEAWRLRLSHQPFHLADMTNTIRRASEMLALRVRVRDTVESAKGRYDFGRVVTQNPKGRAKCSKWRARPPNPITPRS